VTCVVGMTDGTKVYLACDSAYSDTMISSASKSPKVFKKDQHIIGYAGNIGLGQNVCYNFHPDVSNVDDENYMYTSFMPQLREFVCEMTPDFSSKLDAIDDNHTDFIVGIKGRLFEISTFGFQCSEYSYTAIGSGSQIAIGYLFSVLSDELIKNECDYYNETIKAVEAAIYFNPHCQHPILIIEMEK